MEQDLEALRRENQELRRRLEALEADEKKAREHQRWVLKRGGSLLVPLIDKRRVVRNFLAFFRTCTGFAGPRDSWPKRDEVTGAAEALSLSLLRLVIRRRLFYLFITLLALAAPLVQVFLLIEQNRLVDAQNELIHIQSDDIVARGITTGSIVANEINGALLSARNFDALSNMLYRIFSAEAADLTDLNSPEARDIYLRSTAARSHLVLALAKAIEEPASPQHRAPNVAWSVLTAAKTGALPEVLRDASVRIPVLLRSAAAPPAVEAECQRYLVGLSYVLRRSFSLAIAAGQREPFYKLIAPVFERLSAVSPTADNPLKPIFVQMFQDFVLDLSLEPKYGAPEPPFPSNVKTALADGFARLERGVGPHARVNWPRIKALVDVR